MDQQERPNHTLVTVLGTEAKSVVYRLGGVSVDAQLAPLALLKVIPEEERPEEIVAFCTPEAMEKSLPTLRDTAGVPVRAVEIDGPLGARLEEVMRRMAEVVPAGEEVELTVDLTHGPRHFQFLLFGVIRYLAALRGVKIRSVHYGLLRGEEGEIVDVVGLLELDEWVYAVEEFSRTGDCRKIADILSRGSSGQDQDRLVRELRRFSEAYLWALPLELGKISDHLLDQRMKSFRRLLKSRNVPFSCVLVERIEEVLKRFQSDVKARDCQELVPDELKRQARLIADRYSRGDRAQVALLLREWIISWAIWADGRTRNWTDYEEARQPVELKLHTLRQLGERTELRHWLSEEQSKLGGLLGKLTRIRNWFAHAGLSGLDLRQAERELEEVVKSWKQLFFDGELRRFPLDVGGTEESLLVTPLGLSVGVLSSSLDALRSRDIRAKRCLLVCTMESWAKLEDADPGLLQGLEVVRLEIRDPRGGVKEIQGIAKKAEEHLLRARDVYVNLTGGTTLMGLAVQAISERAKWLGRNVSRFVVTEGDPDTGRPGEPFWLPDAGPG